MVGFGVSVPQPQPSTACPQHTAHPATWDGDSPVRPQQQLRQMCTQHQQEVCGNRLAPAVLVSPPAATTTTTITYTALLRVAGMYRGHVVC